MKAPIILLLAIVGCCAVAKEQERVLAENGETIVREFYDDDSLKTVSHLDPSGKLLGTLYYAPKGVPLHLDFFDDQKRVTCIQDFKPDGTPIRKQHLDVQGKVEFIEEFTYKDGKGTDDELPTSDRMTFVTPAGKISFTADGVWNIIALQPKLPSGAVGFQIKNLADEGTPDSTNLVVSIYDAASEKGKNALTKLIGKEATGKIEKSKRGNWETWSYPSKQDATSYRIRDASRKLGGIIVGVRLAWPRLSNNPEDYDAGMEAIFLSVLDSMAADK